MQAPETSKRRQAAVWNLSKPANDVLDALSTEFRMPRGKVASLLICQAALNLMHAPRSETRPASSTETPTDPTPHQETR